jgi:hypothetical protein
VESTLASRAQLVAPLHQAPVLRLLPDRASFVFAPSSKKCSRLQVWHVGRRPFTWQAYPHKMGRRYSSTTWSGVVDNVVLRVTGDVVHRDSPQHFCTSNVIQQRKLQQVWSRGVVREKGTCCAATRVRRSPAWPTRTCTPARRLQPSAHRKRSVRSDLTHQLKGFEGLQPLCTR